MTCSAVRGACGAVLALVLAMGALAAGPPAAADHVFGDEPLDDVLEHAETHRDCGLSRDELAAMMLAVVWQETGAPRDTAPSPMTLGRWDVQRGLHSFTDPEESPDAFWHAGVGMWQFDSAGSGAHLPISARINSWQAANEAARVMSARYCAAGGSDTDRRRAAWQPWVGCRDTADPCGDWYREHYDAGSDTLRGISRDPEVTRHGGMRHRTCRWASSPVEWDCWYIDPARAQGYAAWADPDWGPTPVALPFYGHHLAVNRQEYRHWIRDDTGYGTGVLVRRRLGDDARHGLEWHGRERLCDTGEERGTC
ncbi:hypothetical protein H0B56_03015 [Haloechinothrix sp. YIM 98757]|uniref:Transglycosylase SLT domain-containing protein n=1 Tax=Haloechinothrix aidingensis TaxID=2752311 RepID=A0A837ZWK1_9PSEU|nr:hypothetical protein [Haloechinothrix aidingensis]MBA0124504.1 hypothetical protein [Haloechinothrix aidingensis]